MGDAENTLPPSKKRAAGRELSRDNPGLDDEENVVDQEAGTFKKASEEVLANRRIVKVRRKQTSSTPSAPSSNPFAAIQLVPPANSTITPATVTNIQESQDNAKKEEDGNNQQTENKVKQAKNNEIANEAGIPKLADAESAKEEAEKREVASEATKPESADAESAKEEAEKLEAASETTKPESTDAESVKEEAECEPKKETTETSSVSSFQQLSATQNAFTGIIGTGFSTSSFSFGSITTNNQPNFPSFNLDTNKNSSLFDKTEVNKIKSMQEVNVETGEENEKTVFTSDSVLYEFLEGSWKERGKGELKVNVSTSLTGKSRLVMRARGNYRLILNASLFPDMKLTNMEKKGITFACLNSTGEEKDGFSTFALKFKDTAIVDEFRAIVTQYKGDINTNTDVVSCLKTPENSPKASDE